MSTYLVYQVRDVDSQGHVYVYSGGKCYGNGFYDWPEKIKREEKLQQSILSSIDQ